MRPSILVSDFWKLQMYQFDVHSEVRCSENVWQEWLYFSSVGHWQNDQWEPCFVSTQYSVWRDRWIEQALSWKFASNQVLYYCYLFQKLLKGENNWSLSELVQAIVILTHFHCLSCLVHGCGIVPETDLEGGHTFRPMSLSDNNQSSFETSEYTTIQSNNAVSGSGMTELMEKMKEVEAEKDAFLEVTQEELFQQYEQVESGECECTVALYTLYILLTKCEVCTGKILAHQVSAVSSSACTGKAFHIHCTDQANKVIRYFFGKWFEPRSISSFCVYCFCEAVDAVIVYIM